MEAMVHYATALGASPGRGGYAEAMVAGKLVQTCRERLARLFNGAGPERFVFTLNCTDSICTAVHGLIQPMLRQGQRVHLVATEMEHNSILRPFNTLRRDWGGLVEVTYVACDPRTGHVDPAAVARALRGDTRLVAVQHASNVTGVVQPVEEIVSVCKAAGVPTLVDAAQTAGHLPIDVRALGAEIVTFPGHKGLLGPSGTGVLYLALGMEERIEPVRQGGTGGAAEGEYQPIDMPMRYEAGTSNAIGIVGLSDGVGWALGHGVESIRRHERQIVERFLSSYGDGADFPGLRLLGPRESGSRVAVFSFACENLDPQEAAALLEDQYGILVRAGMLCAPRAQRLLGSEAGGGVLRVSFGPFNTLAEVDRVADALRAVAAGTAGSRLGAGEEAE